MLIVILGIIPCTWLPRKQFLASIKCKSLSLLWWSKWSRDYCCKSFCLWETCLPVPVVSYSMDLRASWFLSWQSWEKGTQNQTLKT